VLANPSRRDIVIQLMRAPVEAAMFAGFAKHA
jgi:hypothetical protein